MPKRIFLVKVCVAVLAGTDLSTLTCHADTVLRYKSTIEDFSGQRFDREEYFQIRLGSNAARWDLSKARSYIVDLDIQRMFILDHLNSEFHELELPIALQDYLKGDQATDYEMIRDLLKPTIVLAVEEQQKVVGEWRTEVYRWAINFSPTYSVELKHWLSQDLQVDEDLYNTLVAGYHSLRFDSNQWIDRVLEPKGIAVRSEYVSERFQGRRKTIEVLESISLHPYSEDRYHPPAGYQKTELDASSLFTLYKP